MRKDRSLFRRALEISLLVHLLLIFLIVPQMQRILPASEEAVANLVPLQQLQEAQQEKPLQFELVELAEERQEAPVSPEVPLSDLDRRAHGGEGEAERRPATQGNTWQLVQSSGNSTEMQASRQPLPPAEQQQPQPQEQPFPEPQEDQSEPELSTGAGQEEQERKAPQLVLPAPRSWALPPEAGMSENPDREGGTVDAEGLSFDTQWYDWGPYAKAMIRKIRRNWRIPEIARLGVSGVVRIRFFIERDGTVTNLQILNESGKPPMDFAARDAIALSSAFAPLPTDLTGVEREGVTITFYYNQRPPDHGGY